MRSFIVSNVFYNTHIHVLFYKQKNPFFRWLMFVSILPQILNKKKKTRIQLIELNEMYGVKRSIMVPAGSCTRNHMVQQDPQLGWWLSGDMHSSHGGPYLGSGHPPPHPLYLFMYLSDIYSI